MCESLDTAPLVHRTEQAPNERPTGARVGHGGGKNEGTVLSSPFLRLA